MIKKFGFTLTEVLVTLSIVGVIAAMTVPTLMSKYQKEAQTVQIRKASQELANAIDMFITAEGKTSLVATGIFDNVDAFITSNLKVVKTCASNDTSCFATNYRSIDNSATQTVNCGGTSYVLANSASICITSVGRYEVANNHMPSLSILNAGRPYLTVRMDTNGSEKPNIGGRDMFTFYVTKKGEIVGSKPDTFEIFQFQPAGGGIAQLQPCFCLIGQVCECRPILVNNTNCTNSPLGEYCFDMLEQNNWKMTY